MEIENKNTLSIVVSAYNEEGNIIKLYEELTNVLSTLNLQDYEILFVNDGSKDKTFELCNNLMEGDARVKIIDFERNFGHEIAMTAGLDNAVMEGVLFMDADLQHPPQVIPEMVKNWQDGYDVVLTRILSNKQKSWLRSLIVRFYYFILNFLSDVKIPPATPDFRLIGRRYVDILKRMEEQERMFRGMLNWLGFKNAKIIEFNAPNRFAGKTHYNFSASLKLAINSIIQFSIKPLRLATYFGILCAITALIFGLHTIYEYFAFQKPASGYTTIVFLISFFASVQLIILGIIGEYIGRIHLETKKRPLYFAKKWERK
jgi:glycosyltransferase involved in cell wall biosynthesis